MPSRRLIPDDKLGGILRNRVLQQEHKKLLIANLGGSKESEDKFTQINCGGYGRRRVFSRFGLHYATDPLLKPRLKCMLISGFPDRSEIQTQVFQLSGCSWRCWYCFVDIDLLRGDAKSGAFLSCDELLAMSRAEEIVPDVIDLSGGQPDLVPEWPFWMMQALDAAGLRNRTYLRMEHNLSEYLPDRFLTNHQIEYMRTFPKFSIIGCLKGYDSGSFSFNTSAHPEGFDRQFDAIEQLLTLGFDVFLHATFTGLESSELGRSISTVFDRLQSIHEFLPLRTVPLKVRDTPAMSDASRRGLSQVQDIQHRAVALWDAELMRRFPREQLFQPVNRVSLEGARRRDH